jgi:CO/xanthine dehydrogenase Mo-binding subunit
LNANLEDYKVATALQVPKIIQEMVDRTDLSANNLGINGVESRRSFRPPPPS